MAHCLSARSDGKQCLNKPSVQAGTDMNFCRHHQKSTPKDRTTIETKAEDIKEEIKLHPSRKLTVLSGPSLFYYYPNIQGKKILLLGENHTNKYICKENYCESKVDCQLFEVDDWLYQLATHTSQCLDIFVEEAYYDVQTGGAGLNTYAAPLLAIREKFKYTRPKYIKEGKNPLTNTRYHSVDIRNVLEGTSPFVDMAHMAGGGLKYAMGKTPLEFKSKDNMKIILGCLMGCNRNIMAQKMFYAFTMQLFISIEQYNDAKGISEMPYDMDSWVVEKLEEINAYIRKLDTLVNKEISKSLPYIKKDKFCETLLSVYMEYIGENWDKFIHALIMLPMDIYLLLRLFIKYEPSKMSRGPAGCRSELYGENKNVIIYTGGLHTDIYRHFLSKYFTVTPTISQNRSPDQCIELSTPFDFFAI